MSPVPEPMHSRGGPPNGEEEGFTPPIGAVIMAPVSSSDEEIDPQESGDNPPGYQPLNQDPQDEDQPSYIDYSSLSGLMAAMNTHGPNVIDSDDDENDDDSEDDDHPEGEDSNVRSQISMSVDWNQLEASANLEEAARQESAEIWNTATPVESNRLSLDSERVEEIKAAMSTFSLPPAAIPPWAQGLSQEEWNKQVITRIKGSNIKPDQEGER